jgi:murein DD-endopeptidase MepM/ murein hydrolase activator NlpD
LKFGSAIFFAFSFFSNAGWAQLKHMPASPQKGTTTASDYLYPVTPGVINTLAGTMGELRATHFHSGIDVRTNNQIGAAILAAQDGYISRVVKSSYSYGNVIFVHHPDSNTTLYAHLHELKGRLADHVRREQYNQKTFEIDLRFSPDQFPVKKGDTIAWSGNTGSSNGPHLHFDIRDKEMNALNPLDFGFEEIPDKIKPVVQKIALRTMDINSRINGRFGRFEFYTLKVGEDYVLPKPILAIGKIAVEILAFDRMDNSRFQCGINAIEMLIDSQRVFRQHIDKINMPLTRGILSLMDYKTMEQTYYRFNKLFIEDGNPLAFYEGTINRGIISILEKDVSVKIDLADTYGNRTQVRFGLKHDHTSSRALAVSDGLKPLAYSINENVLQVTGKACKDTTAQIFIGGNAMQVLPAYTSLNTRTFLYDLKKAIPDSVQSCGEKIYLNVQDVVPSKTDYTYYGKDMMVFFQDSALFDTLYFSVSTNTLRPEANIIIGDKYVPLMREIKVVWNPPGKFDTLKHSVYRVNGDAKKFYNLGGKWEGEKITFGSNKFGEFVILPDTIPPAITRIACNQTYARFRINDNLSGIYSFEASVNGEWLLMNYDYKSGILYSEKLDKMKPLKGDFVLKVMDWNRNESVYQQKIP